MTSPFAPTWCLDPDVVYLNHGSFGACPRAVLEEQDRLRTLDGLLPGGWTALRGRNHALALEARALLAEALGVELPCPDGMIGSLAALPLPDSHHTPAGRAEALDPLQEALFADHRIEVPVVRWPAAPRRLLRISAQLYNARDDYELLANVLRRLLDRI